MNNLLTETLEVLTAYDLSPDDVLWIGSSDGLFVMDWQSFATLANRKYDSGYGAPEVAMDLVIVGQSWWLEREEYDGLENWVYKKMPSRRPEPNTINHLFVDDLGKVGWETVHSLNQEQER